MQIAIDARYVREKPSGIGVYVQALVDRLPRLAPADRFLFWAHPLAPRPLSPSPNTVDLTVRPGPNSPWPVVWPRRYAAFDGVDLFHSPHNLLPRGITSATVVTVHDVMSIERPELHLHGLERAVKSLYYPQAVWRALERATRIIVPTRATADRAVALVPSAAPRIRVILEAAESTFAPPADRDAAARDAAKLTGTDAPYFVVVGAVAATKRHHVALAAFAQAAPAPWRLVFVHRQGSRDRLMRLARRLGVADRVVWLWRSGRREVATLLQAAGALIQPSVYEGFGLPVIEAMACGCPIIASDIPPFREVTGGAAILVPADDVQKFASAIREVAGSNDRRRSLSEQALARAEVFSWDRCAAETLAVYGEAARERR
jgi:glycosyltransferase involved in cell wall biosynthesis